MSRRIAIDAYWKETMHSCECVKSTVHIFWIQWKPIVIFKRIFISFTNNNITNFPIPKRLGKFSVNSKKVLFGFFEKWNEWNWNNEIFQFLILTDIHLIASHHQNWDSAKFNKFNKFIQLAWNAVASKCLMWVMEIGDFIFCCSQQLFCGDQFSDLLCANLNKWTNEWKQEVLCIVHCALQYFNNLLPSI